MIKIDDGKLVEDLVSTIYEVSGSTRKDFLKKEYNNFTILNESLAKNNSKIVKSEKIIGNGEIFTDSLSKAEYDAYWAFVDKVDYEQELIRRIAIQYVKYLKRIRFTEFDYFDSVRNYSEKDFKDIILSYYNTYGDKYYNIVKKYFDENRINIGSANIFDDASGYFASLLWLNSGYIYSVYHNFNSLTASSLVHELGHAIDAETFLFPQQKKIQTFSDIFIEVPSTAFEIGFYDYLKNQKIDKDGGEVLLNNRICCLYAYFKEYRDAVNNKTLNIIQDGVAVNEYGYRYDFRNDILYGIGYYFALHLNAIREKDPQEFLKVLNTLNTSRNEATLEEMIKKTGFNYEDFITGKNIKPTIENNALELKKRYKLY